MKVIGNIYDYVNRRFFFGAVHFSNHLIDSVQVLEPDVRSDAPYLVPGFVDAHVHIESSLLVPSEFARLAVIHGTVGTVSDPHEIANVCGVEGIDFMIRNGLQVPFHFNFGAPSCVPATAFETSGAQVTAAQVNLLLSRPEIRYLSEVMNFPGVLQGDPDMVEKIELAKKHGKVIDGHAPGLMGAQAVQYIDAGISTDHECFTAPEALWKLEHGMKVLIREGSAARNFDALIDLLPQWHTMLMFCSDDKHPDSLLEGHINKLCARAVAKGIDADKVIEVACINPVKHYGLPIGLLQLGDPADFVVLKNLQDFEVLETYINGLLVASKGESFIQPVPVNPINHFAAIPLQSQDIVFEKASVSHWMENGALPVMVALDGQLITEVTWVPMERLEKDQILVSNTDHDLLKMVVVNRYMPAKVAKAFVKNFGLKKGALAGSVAHDSHNIIAVGVDDESLLKAINLVIENKGGLSVACESIANVLPLPVAGLMSAGDAYSVADQYAGLDHLAKVALGSTLRAPFMTLSFMALLVIPHLKLSDRGLFNGDRFTLYP